MEIKILAHGNTSPEKVQMFQKTAKFYAKYLNIEKFKYKVYVCIAPKLRQRDGNKGVCAKTGDKEISIAVDSALALPQMLMTLAHEMVHVKQLSKGLLKQKRSGNIWLGKMYSNKTPYLDMPWEIEAFSKQELILRRAFEE
jgi:uncharacterized protein YjaZ